MDCEPDTRDSVLNPVPNIGVGKPRKKTSKYTECAVCAELEITHSLGVGLQVCDAGKLRQEDGKFKACMGYAVI